MQFFWIKLFSSSEEGKSQGFLDIWVSIDRWSDWVVYYFIKIFALGEFNNLSLLDCWKVVFIVEFGDAIGLYIGGENWEALLNIDSAFIFHNIDADYLCLLSRFNCIHVISNQNDFFSSRYSPRIHIGRRLLDYYLLVVAVYRPTFVYEIGTILLTWFAYSMVDNGLRVDEIGAFGLPAPITFIEDFLQLIENLSSHCSHSLN